MNHWDISRRNIDQLFEARLARFQCRRRRYNPRIDPALAQRRDQVGHPLQMGHLHVLAGNHACLLKQDAGGQIGGRSRQGDAENLAAQIGKLTDVGLAVNGKHRAIQNTDNESDPRTAQAGFDQLGGGIDDVHTAGQKRLGARGGQHVSQIHR
jgi:hypothetical protein